MTQTFKLTFTQRPVESLLLMGSSPAYAYRLALFGSSGASKVSRCVQPPVVADCQRYPNLVRLFFSPARMPPLKPNGFCFHCWLSRLRPQMRGSKVRWRNR